MVKHHWPSSLDKVNYFDCREKAYTVTKVNQYPHNKHVLMP